jgi:hypothetical protein
MDNLAVILEDGFDMRLSQPNGAVGAGVYFATAAITSVSYVKPSTQPVHHHHHHHHHHPYPPQPQQTGGFSLGGVVAARNHLNPFAASPYPAPAPQQPQLLPGSMPWPNAQATAAPQPFGFGVNNNNQAQMQYQQAQYMNLGQHQPTQFHHQQPVIPPDALKMIVAKVAVGHSCPVRGPFKWSN